MHLHAQGIATQYCTLDGSDLIAQRNRLRTSSSPRRARILFIDSDMAFARDLGEVRLAAVELRFGMTFLDYVKALSAQRSSGEAQASSAPLLGRNDGAAV